MRVVSREFSALGQAPEFKPPKIVVTGQHVAKATVHYPPEVRAANAAGWVTGDVAVRPTARQACAFFNVSYARLRQAQARLGYRERNKRRSPNGNGTAVPAISPAISDAVLDNMIAELGPDRFWAALDRYTAPQLPLVAVG
jgi:hypothetical protein